INKHKITTSTYNLLLNKTTTTKIQITTPKKFNLLPNNINLTTTKIQLINQNKHKQHLKHTLTPIHNKYNFTLINYPPTLSLLTLNTLT
ncbi:AAA family ATPase, partial [Escherichia coli]|nr:AAA family ATPase [Escherichia coli]